MAFASGGLLLVGVAVWAAVSFVSHGSPRDGGSAFRAVAAQDDRASARAVREKRIRERDRRPEAVARTKPDISAALADEEVNASPALRALFTEIQSALDSDDRRRLIKAVQAMQDTSEWPNGIPTALHLSAIDALRWFGSATVPELLGYLEALDEDVVENATDAMLEALSDFSLSDSERAALLLGYIRVVHDADTLDMMLMELDNMRPTVRAETGIAIFESGNGAAVNVLAENVEFFFGDFDDVEVTRPEDLQAYLEHAKQVYIDDPEQAEADEDFYGGDKDMDL